MNTTVWIYLCVALALIVILFFVARWQYNRKKASLEKRAASIASGEMSVDDDEDGEDDGFAKPAMPSETPPIYEKIEAEKKAAAQKAALEAKSSMIPGALGLDACPYDRSVQWKLSIIPDEGRTITFGAVESLVKSLKALHYHLPIEVWAQSKRDKKYYPARFLPSEALNVVITVVFTNRVAILTEEMASIIYSRAEELATQCDAQLTASKEVEEIQGVARDNERYVNHFNKFLDLVISAPQGEELPIDILKQVLTSLGFEKRHDQWVLKTLPHTREGEFSLYFRNEERSRVMLSLNLPLCNLARGDFSRFFMLANHIASHCRAKIVDIEGNSFTIQSVLNAESDVRMNLERMAEFGVVSGSERAHLLFSCGAD